MDGGVQASGELEIDSAMYLSASVDERLLKREVGRLVSLGDADFTIYAMRHGPEPPHFISCEISSPICKSRIQVSRWNDDPAGDWALDFDGLHGIMWVRDASEVRVLVLRDQLPCGALTYKRRCYNSLEVPLPTPDKGLHGHEADEFHVDFSGARYFIRASAHMKEYFGGAKVTGFDCRIQVAEEDVLRVHVGMSAAPLVRPDDGVRLTPDRSRGIWWREAHEVVLLAELASGVPTPETRHR
jgi:hypothetical protein